MLVSPSPFLLNILVSAFIPQPQPFDCLLIWEICVQMTKWLCVVFAIKNRQSGNKITTCIVIILLWANPSTLITARKCSNDYSKAELGLVGEHLFTCGNGFMDGYGNEGRTFLSTFPGVLCSLASSVHANAPHSSTPIYPCFVMTQNICHIFVMAQPKVWILQRGETTVLHSRHVYVYLYKYTYM